MGKHSVLGSDRSPARTHQNTRVGTLGPPFRVRDSFGGKVSAPKGCGNSAARVRPEGAQECSHGWSPGLPGRNPWSFCENALPPRMGRRQFNCCTRAPAVEHSSTPDGAGSSLGIGAHGFRSGLPALASPVATVLGPIRGRRKCHGPRRSDYASLGLRRPIAKPTGWSDLYPGNSGQPQGEQVGHADRLGEQSKRHSAHGGLMCALSQNTEVFDHLRLTVYLGLEHDADG